MSQLKLIILDFDGTLVDTRRANALAYIETLGEVGIELHEEEYLANYFGVRCMEFLRKIGITDDNQIAHLRRRKVELYPKYFESVQLNEPLWSWCQMARRMGVKVWIASTGHKDNIANVMRYLNLDNGVDGILTGDDVAHPKPAPDCFLKVMQQVGVKPSETIIFEDSDVGIEAARRSGASYFVVRI